MERGIFATEKQFTQFVDLAHRCHAMLASIEGLTRNEELAASVSVVNNLAAMGANDILAILDLFGDMTDAGHHVTPQPSIG